MVPTDLSSHAAPLPEVVQRDLVLAARQRVGVDQRAIDLNFASAEEVPLPLHAVDLIARVSTFPCLPASLPPCLPASLPPCLPDV